MKVALISFVTAFSTIAVISVTYPLIDTASAAERSEMPGRRVGGGTR